MFVRLHSEKESERFGLLDGIILASARSIDQRLMTKDKHFEGIGDIVLI